MRVAPTKAKSRPPVRVRRDPPTLEEAVFAARGLTDEPDQQAEIAAALMDVTVEEAIEMVRKSAASARRMQNREVAFATNRSGAERAVVVERKTPRRPMMAIVERKSQYNKIEHGDGVTVERTAFRGLGVGQPRTLIRLGGSGR